MACSQTDHMEHTGPCFSNQVSENLGCVLYCRVWAECFTDAIWSLHLSIGMQRDAGTGWLP